MDTSFTNIKNLLKDPSGFSLNKLNTEAETIKLKDRKPVIDVALRSRMLELLSSHSIDEVKALLKIGVAAALANICSAATPFLLFADVFNTKPISVCQDLFGFMEEAITTLKDVPLFSSGRNTLLRMCNDLLRRLSKSQNTVFCGQIQLFLSRLFPLDEKSGLNLMSNFNVDKEIPYNKTPEPFAFKHSVSSRAPTDKLEEGETTDHPVSLDVDANLYVKFWSIQEFFKIPTMCFDKNKWTFFQHSADTVLEIFSSIKLIFGAEGGGPVETNSNKFSKYLTSEKLLDLQLRDLSFRRYILVQFLIIFQYLTTPNKFKTAEQCLSDEQLEWVNRKHESVLRLLADTTKSSRGQQGQLSDSFVSVVERVLERELQWNRWKNEGCPSFIRSVEKSPGSPRKRRVNPLVDRAGNRIIRLGNRELDKLWNVCPDNLAACRDERRLFRPNLQTYFHDAVLELDPAEKVAEEYRSVNKEEWCWRSLRCLSRRSAHFYINWNPPGRPVKDYLTVILTEKLQAEEDKKSTNAFEPSVSSVAPNPDPNKAEPSPAKQPRLSDNTLEPVEHPLSRPRKPRQTGMSVESSGSQRIPKTAPFVSKVHSGSVSRNNSKEPSGDVFDPDDSLLDEDEFASKTGNDSYLEEDKETE